MRFFIIVLFCCGFSASFCCGRNVLAPRDPDSNNYPALVKFVKGCIGFWKLIRPKIITDEGSFGRALMSAQSRNFLQFVIRVGFSERDFLKMISRDRGPIHAIVIGDRKVVLKALQLAFTANMLIRKGALILLCLDCAERPLEVFEGSDFLGNVIIGIPAREQQSNVLLYEVTYDYRVRKLTSTAIGNWDVDGFHVIPVWPNGAFCFRNATFRVMTIKTWPYIEEYNDSTGMSAPKDFAGSILVLMSQLLNFRFEVQVSKSVSYGEMGPNNTFTGAIADFIKNKCDLALGVFSLTPDRLKVIDFTAPFARGQMSFVARIPSKISKQAWMVAIRSFESDVWIAIFIFLALTGNAIAFALYWGYPKTAGKAEWTSTLLAAWLQQGKEHMLRPTSAKIVVLTTYAFCWAACCFYNGVLTSYLTLDTTAMMSTIAELSDSDYAIGIIRGTSSSEMLKGSKIPTLQAMYRKAVVNDTTEMGFRHLCNTDNYALLSGVALTYSLSKRIPNCKYYFVKEALYNDDYHFITQKNSVLNKRLSKAIIKLRESGLLPHLENVHHLTKPTDYAPKDKKESIYFHQLIGPFSLLLGGMSVSLVAVIFEIFHHLLRQHKPDATLDVWKMDKIDNAYKR